MEEWAIYKYQSELGSDRYRIYYIKSNMFYDVYLSTFAIASYETISYITDHLYSSNAITYTRVPMGKLLHKPKSVKILKKELRKLFPEEFI